MNDTSLFESNLNLFGRFNPPMPEVLRTTDCKGVDFCNTEKGELNLTADFNGQKIYLHAQEGALDEAKFWLDYQLNLNIDVLFFYGVGLGYYYDVLKEWLRENPRRHIVFIEDDLRVLHRFLETKKAEEILHDPQVFITPFYLDPKNEWKSFEDQFRWFLFAFSEHSCRLATLPLYLQIKHRTSWALSELFTLLYSKVQTHLCMQISDCYHEEFPNFFQNIPYIYQSYLAEKLHKMFCSIPAIICGAGPSLAKHFDLLKTVTDKALVFGAGSALNALSRNYITAHFGGGVDPTMTQKSRAITNFAYEIPIFYINRYNHEAYLTTRGPKLFVRGTVGFELSDWFEDRIGLEKLENRDVDFGVSTSNFLTKMAVRLGCPSIILSGMDLSYTSSKRYAPGIQAHPTDNLFEKQFVHINGKEGPTDVNVYGEEVQTTNIWRYESYFYSNLSRKYEGIKFINASEGLEIPEVPHMKLDEALKKVCNRSYDLYGRVQACLHNSKLTIPFSTVREAIDEWKDSCDAIQDYCEKIDEKFNDLKQEVERGKEIGDIWTEELSGLVREMNEFPPYRKVFAAPFFQLGHAFMLDQAKFDCHPEIYTKKDRLIRQIEFEQKRYFTLKEWSKWHKTACVQGLKKYLEREKIKKEVKVENRVPIPQKSGQDSYSFDNGVLQIKDAEMGIALEASFQPTMISEEQKEKGFIVEDAVIELVNEIKGKWEGQYLLYYPSRKLLGECYYLHGDLHGPSRFYSEEGKLLAETWFYEGKREGKAWFYYVEGNLAVLERYRSGLLDGKQEYYTSEGLLKTVLNYKNGLLHGEVLLYFPNGLKEREIHFDEGELDGFERHWDVSGQLILESEYKKGKPVNRSRTWYLNGQIAKQYIYYGHPDCFDLTEWDMEGKMVNKVIYVPKNAIDEMKEKSKEISDTVAELRKELAKFEKKD